jgi:CubicO group peptidase (beta-lactamase class C family)
VRRATGKTVGTVLRDAIADPLQADVHFGLPVSDHGRVAEFLWGLQPVAEFEPQGVTDAQLMEYNAYNTPAGLSGGGVVNTAAWRSAEIPSTNPHASARGVERVYAALANDGALGDVRIADAETLAAFTAVHSDGDDLILHRPSRFGAGFQLTQPERPLGPNARAFGHFGAGGALGFCDPDAGVAFGYVMNAMGPRWQNPRNRGLINAVYSSLAT